MKLKIRDSSSYCNITLSMFHYSQIALCQCDTETFIKPIYFAQQFKGQKLIELPALNFYNVSTWILIEYCKWMIIKNLCNVVQDGLQFWVTLNIYQGFFRIYTPKFLT